VKTPLSITEQQLREIFDQNFARLRLENGHSLGLDVRDAAWEQVRCYWRKLRHIAETVTDTEVKLNLPNQKTPKNRTFCIEGVVDIVREGEKVTMYDLKTHELEFVQQNIELYRDQLNVYAYIWQNLRGERLDQTAVIATPVPEAVSAAIRTGEPAQIEAAFAAWDPVVPIAFDAGNVKKTITEFAQVVDRIEDNEFHPPPLSILAQRDGKRGPFATRVCRNCDMRFSCSSYREYARNYRIRGWSKFADFYDLKADEAESLARFAATAIEEGEFNDGNDQD
jgi:hypothetical protein